MPSNAKLETPVTEAVRIRRASVADLGAINAIFNHYVAHSTCVWTTEPCSDGERQAWYEEHGDSLPVLVAEANGRVVGWAALGTFRAAYTAAGTLEDSVYVHPDFLRRGVGSRLLQALIEEAGRMGLRSILANISADQVASIRLHERFGFEPVAHLRRVGRKFDRMLDAVYLQRLLPAGEGSPDQSPDQTPSATPPAKHAPVAPGGARGSP